MHVVELLRRRSDTYDDDDNGADIEVNDSTLPSTASARTNDNIRGRRGMILSDCLDVGGWLVAG